MLYIGAVEGAGIYLAPRHVYRMTDEQALLRSDAERVAYRENALASRGIYGRRWYADNTREPIRDETLREGLMTVGAVVARQDLPTTSSQPRYALTRSFAALFDPGVAGDAFERAVETFQQEALTPGALARIAIIRHGAARGAAGHLVTFPNHETRQLAPGVSSTITKAVIEGFAIRYLRDPAVLLVSESEKKIVARDESLAASIGLKLATDRDLPDIVLVDIGASPPTLVFVEVVATDGPVTERRKEALLKQTDSAGFPRSQVIFVTAYVDRESSAYRRTSSSVAWDSFIWFASEPEQIMVLRRGGPRPLDELAR